MHKENNTCHIRRSIVELERQRLFGRDAATALEEGSFTAHRITVWDTDGADKSLKSWKKVGEFELGHK